MSKINELHKKSISSDKLSLQILGALIHCHSREFWVFVLLVIPVTIGVSFILSPNCWLPCFYLLGMNLVVWLTFKTCRQLADVFSLRKNEGGITWCYIAILGVLILWIIGFVLIFNVKGNDKLAVAMCVIGSLLTWIFQDKIKGAVTFMHLRMNHLLNIGDKIIVPKYDVGGEVKRITLTTVILYNWDTTLSVIPLSALHTDHFINSQNMMEGKTYGRKMSKTFILDTSWFRPLSKEETVRLRNKIAEYAKSEESRTESGKDAIYDFISATEVEEKMLNAKLFRLYIFHWLMNHKHVSHQPRLVVRWLEHVEGGMPLEIHAFLIDTGMVAFEWQQSQIIEHVIEALDWFGLRLYQSPSAFDATNLNVYASQEQQTYKKVMTDEL